jgi:hypothetical protein
MKTRFGCNRSAILRRELPQFRSSLLKNLSYLGVLFFFGIGHGSPTVC